MESPFRDDREAAHMRSAQLAEENEQLRGELAEAKKPKVPPPPRSRVLVGALVGGIVAAFVLVGAATFLFRGPPSDRGPMTPPPTETVPEFATDLGPGGMVAPDEKERITISWTSERAETTSTLRGVWTSGHEAYAVGEGGTILYRAPNRIPSKAWSSLPSGTTANLNAVSDAPPAFSTEGDSVIYAVGEHGTILRLGNSRAWVREPSGTTENLLAVMAFADWLLVVGSGGTVLARDAKGTWKPSVSGTKEALYGLAVASGGRLYAAGDKGTIIAADQKLHWTAQQSGTTDDFRAIVSAGGDLFAVGARGTILRAPGVGTATWASEASLRDSELLAACGGHGRYDAREGTVSSTGVTDFVLAVGRRGVGLVDDLHAKKGFEGSAFERSVIFGETDLYAVGTSRTDAFAVGAKGAILHGVLAPIGN